MVSWGLFEVQLGYFNDTVRVLERYTRVIKLLGVLTANLFTHMTLNLYEHQITYVDMFSKSLSSPLCKEKSHNI